MAITPENLAAEKYARSAAGVPNEIRPMLAQVQGRMIFALS